MPEPPMPSVKGQVRSDPALQDSMSMLSLDPAARTFGCAWSTATAGSFCLFAEKGPDGLPTVTSTSPPGCADAGMAVAPSTSIKVATAAGITDRFTVLLLVRSGSMAGTRGRVHSLRAHRERT